MTSSGSDASVKAVKPRRSQNTTVTSRRWLANSDFRRVRGRNHLRHLRRQESLQAADPLDLGQLIRDALLEQPIPARQLLGLLLQLLRLQLHRVVKFLDAQQRSHARHQRGLLERLGQIVVTAGLETIDDVARVGLGRDQDDGHETKRCVLLELLEHRDAVELRHHDVEQDEIGLELARAHQRILAVDRRDDLVALRVEPDAQHFQIGRIVVDDQDSRRSSQARPPRRQVRNSRTLARITRGLNGLAK